MNMHSTKIAGPVRPAPRKRRRFRDQLTYERAHEVLTYDPATGELRWKIARPGRRAGTVAGTLTPIGYVRVEIDYVIYPAHRVIWLMETGAWPSELIDHKNGIRNDNRWRNLREATYSENARHRRRAKNNRSGVPGVSWSTRRRKWAADIWINGRNRHLGHFECIADAAAVRCEAVKHHFGAFALDAAAYPVSDTDQTEPGVTENIISEKAPTDG